VLDAVLAIGGVDLVTKADRRLPPLRAIVMTCAATNERSLRACTKADSMPLDRFRGSFATRHEQRFWYCPSSWTPGA
jgi:hypothetical protein